MPITHFALGRVAIASFAVVATVGTSAASHAFAQNVVQASPSYDQVTLPLVTGWYDGRPALYISTETSDRQVAAMTHITYSPKLANAIAGNAVDDIYMITNFHQGNVIPLAPAPEGPGNQRHQYTPLWQLNLVTWKQGSHPHLLRSEAAILAEVAQGHATVQKTNIVINCPIIYTPQGGLFPGAKLQR